MKNYGQFCPVAKAAEVFCERWTALILRDLAAGPRRFSELKRGVPLMSPSLLAQRLRWLAAEGVVERRQSAGRHAIYDLTEAGRDFAPLVKALGIWGQRWSRRELAPHEMDIGLLLWAMEQGACADAFGERRTVLQLDFIDQPAHKRRWWFLVEGGRTELCIGAPKLEIDLFVEVSLADMIRIWRGDLSLRRALDEDRVELAGERDLRRRFGRWLARAAIAGVRSRRR